MKSEEEGWEGGGGEIYESKKKKKLLKQKVLLKLKVPQFINSGRGKRRNELWSKKRK